MSSVKLKNKMGQEFSKYLHFLPKRSTGYLVMLMNETNPIIMQNVQNSIDFHSKDKTISKREIFIQRTGALRIRKMSAFISKRIFQING